MNIILTERDTILLLGKNNQATECYVRGGICWPVIHEVMFDGIAKDEISGYAVLALQDIKTKIIKVISEIGFSTISNLRIDDRLFLGVGPWLIKNYANFYCKKYFFGGQSGEVVTKWRLEVVRDSSIEPRPSFIEVHMPADEVDDPVVWMAIQHQTIRLPAGGRIEAEIRGIRPGEKKVLPAFQAVRSLIVGLQKYPWKAERYA